MVWEAHRSFVSYLSIQGHHSDILSCSDDHSVLLWTRVGVLKGVLTYGKEIDKLVKPRWNSLVDMEIREQIRTKVSRKLIEDLKLNPTDPKHLKIMMNGTTLPNPTRINDIIANKEKLEVSHDNLTDPERIRVVGQLHGKITYQQSDKDLALSATVEMESKMLEIIRNIGVVFLFIYLFVYLFLIL